LGRKIRGNCFVCRIRRAGEEKKKGTGIRKKAPAETDPTAHLNRWVVSHKEREGKGEMSKGAGHPSHHGAGDRSCSLIGTEGEGLRGGEKGSGGETRGKHDCCGDVFDPLAEGHRRGEKERAGGRIVVTSVENG